MTCFAQAHFKRVLDEQEMMSAYFETKRNKLDSWRKELEKREALLELEKQKLDEEKRKVIICIHIILSFFLI